MTVVVANVFFTLIVGQKGNGASSSALDQKPAVRVSRGHAEGTFAE
jgi:hypothetical protein